MSSTTEHAIERLRQVPEDRQDLLAKLLLHEIEEDERWMQSTALHTEPLQRLVDRILEADDRSECEPLDPDEL